MKKRFFKRLIATALVTTMTVNTCVAAYAEEQPNNSIVSEAQERVGFKPVIQCENFDIQCGSKNIAGEISETENIATLHDGIISMLGDETVVNTTDYLGDSVISNKVNTYSTNMYNANAGIVNLSEVIVAENNIGFGASEVSGDNAILYSKNGDINFYCGNVDFTGIIYAPNGIVRFEGSNININGVVIAKEVIVRAGTFNITYNEGIAKSTDNLDYVEFNELFSIGTSIDEDEEGNQTAYIQWEEDKTISSIEIYARYNSDGFKRIAETTATEYVVAIEEIKDFADYRVIAKTIYGETISSNIVTLVNDESGIYESTVDTDKDGIPDGYEYLIGTDALITDTDGDGFDDGYEANVLCTNPIEFNNDADFDKDGSSNLEEYSVGTNPYLTDSDFDGLSDKEDAEPTKTNVDTGKEIDYTVSVNEGIFDLVSKYVDDNGNKCEIVWNCLNGQIKYISDSKNSSYNVYNKDNQLIAAIEYVNDDVIGNMYSYIGDNIETITHNGFQYKFTYDENDNLINVQVGDRTLINSQYSGGELIAEQYGNGDVCEYVYDENGNIIAQKLNGNIAYEWIYDEDGNIISYKDLVREETVLYSYDEEGNLESAESDNGFKIFYYEDENTYSVTYENKGVSKKFNVIQSETDIEASEEATTTTNLISGGKLVSVVTDEEVNSILYVNDEITFETKYSYSDSGITKIEYKNGKILEYAYDEAGNIISVIENGEEKLSYEYDDLGQLVRENNLYTEKTVIYVYDNAGNILASYDYEYTTEKVGECLASKVYEYKDEEWKDLLTGFNGQTITYDEIGNPLTYRDGMEFQWTGRQLVSVQNGEDIVSYTYNNDGIRTSKTVNGVTTTYQLEGSKIVFQTTDGQVIWFVYDANDSVVGFQNDDGTYYFEKNAQGDIVRIFDEEGNYVSEYIYDAWGNVVEILGDKEIAEINPFRYRGYYQDNETGFYYLQSRYYDSVTGRFLNADSIIGINGEILSHNMFAYCANNCVNTIDASGYFGTPIQWICATIGGIVGWYFGDYVARALGFFPGKWWQWQTYAYWTVRAVTIAGTAILSWVAGTKLLNIITNYLVKNPAKISQFPNFVQKALSWLCGLGGTKSTQYVNELYSKYEAHIFSSSHIKDGIMKLGTSKEAIFKKIVNVIQSKIGNAANGSNQIHTNINGIKVTIRFYIQDGEIKSLNAFVGWAERVIGKLLK